MYNPHKKLANIKVEIGIDNSNNTKYSTINSYANKKIDISSRTSKKINMNEKSKKYLNIYITNGWLSERKSGKKCFKIIH